MKVGDRLPLPQRQRPDPHSIASPEHPVNFSHRLARPIAEHRLSHFGSTRALALMRRLAPTGSARASAKAYRQGLPAPQPSIEKRL